MIIANWNRVYNCEFLLNHNEFDNETYTTALHGNTKITTHVAMLVYPYIDDSQLIKLETMLNVFKKSKIQTQIKTKQRLNQFVIIPGFIAINNVPNHYYNPTPTDIRDAMFELDYACATIKLLCKKYHKKQWKGNCCPMPIFMKMSNKWDDINNQFIPKYFQLSHYNRHIHNIRGS